MNRAATIGVSAEAKRRRFRVSRNPLIAAAGLVWLLEAKLAAAQAAVADADAGVATARAALAGLNADEGLAAAQVRAAQTSIQSADAEYSRAASDRVRFEALVAQGFATRRDVERVRATAIGAQSARARVLADRDVTSEQAAVTRARRPVLIAQLAQAEAAALRARAALELARQNQGHTIVRAPIDGVVGNRQVQTGDFVQPGSRLLTLVPSRALYVVANFKETQTGAMHPGQAATIKVDALDGDPPTGTVESFAPGSGSEFALLPFEPGSGNFTKIVQRVPVRIRLDPGQATVARLRPGLSVTARPGCGRLRLSEEYEARLQQYRQRTVALNERRDASIGALAESASLSRLASSHARKRGGRTLREAARRRLLSSHTSIRPTSPPPVTRMRRVISISFISAARFTG